VDSELQLALLGAPQLSRDGVPVVGLAYRKSLALLTYLAITGRAHSREALAGLLWGQATEANARASLRKILAELRRHLPAHLTITRQTVAFNDAAPHWLDVAAFRRKIGHGTGARDGLPRAGGADALAEAIELYRGDFLEGFHVRRAPAFEEWVVQQRESLRLMALRALHTLAEVQAAQHAYELAIQYTSRLLALEPGQEEAHRQLMALLALSGQRDAALGQYRVCCRDLAELGAEPGEETSELCEQIRSGAELQAPPPTLGHNLPTPLTRLIGREAELALVASHLRDPACRLVTVIGPGGSGKTHLALEAAAGFSSEPQLDSFPHGVYLVPLSPLASVEAIVPAMARAIGLAVQDDGRSRRQLLDFLHGKRLLLVLDSFEHLLDGADLIADILAAAPEVKVLATSRARLGVVGEHLCHLDGLECPEPSLQAPEAVQAAPAVQLFLTSARRLQSDLALAPGEIHAVAQVCRYVEGLPLGILLAAGWTGVLRPAEIATELSRADSGMLDFLGTDRRAVPARQRSLRAVFDHSWNLLTEPEQAILAALSVFRGGFAREAAEQVAGATLRDLLSLTDRSLLQRTISGRYSLHALLRQYAADRRHRAEGGHRADKQDWATSLDGVPVSTMACSDRHCAYYAEALSGWKADLKGPQQQVALSHIEAELENVQAAWRWAAEQRHAVHLDRSMDALCLFYEWRGRCREGKRACRLAVRQLSATGDLDGSATRIGALAKALAWRGVFNYYVGRAGPAVQLLRRSLALLDSLSPGSAPSVPVLSGASPRPGLVSGGVLGPGLQAAALAEADQAVQTRGWNGAASLVDPPGDLSQGVQLPAELSAVRAFALWRLGRIMFDLERSLARPLEQRSLALYRALGDRWNVANVLEDLGWLARYEGDHDEARKLGRECLALRRAIGNTWGISRSLKQLSSIAYRQGRLEEAEDLIEQCLAVSLEPGCRAEEAERLSGSGWILTMLGRFAEGASRLKESTTIWQDLGLPNQAVRLGVPLGLAQMHLGNCQEAHTLVEAGLHDAEGSGDRGRAGFALLARGWVAMVRGAPAKAQKMLSDGAAIFLALGERSELGEALALLGYADLALGQVAQAREHLCKALRLATNNHFFLPAIYALPATALLLVARGESERGVALHALVSRFPFVANSRWMDDIVGRPIAVAAASLPAGAVTKAEERGRAWDLWVTAAELVAELEEAGSPGG
jgi:DNA-binding SARP family transcriptional activator/predicted ATPase